ncbi:MAG: type II toxin-antitoxin system HicB family antitoxin [Candidatus Coatesbacteria bacterium]|nr:type II toxin-antitoxin system HicB family antitoxin [Candidatus Coatesbacteria bacterium]
MDLQRCSSKRVIGWIGYAEELPGTNTQGRTLDETRSNLREAIKLVLEANRELACREAAT